MPDHLSQFMDVLKAKGYSTTTVRRSVFNALQQSEPISMHVLIDRCSPDIDRASVYRTVKLFELLGIVQRLQIGWKYKLELSNRFQHHHHHMICTMCGAMTAMAEDPTLEKRLASLTKQYNFQLRDHQLEIQGICEQCQRIPN